MLDIQRISKTFNPGTVNEKKAITDLSLHLNKGEFVTVIGSNGAGKSTLFNAIAGSFYVDDGAITVGGHDMTVRKLHLEYRIRQSVDNGTLKLDYIILRQVPSPPRS